MIKKIKSLKNIKLGKKSGGSVGNSLEGFGQAQAIFNLFVASIILLICIIISILLGVGEIKSTATATTYSSDGTPKQEKVNKYSLIAIIMGMPMVLLIALILGMPMVLHLILRMPMVLQLSLMQRACLVMILKTQFQWKNFRQMTVAFPMEI